MGLLDGLKGLRGRGTSSQSEDFILLSLGDISSALVKHLSADYYRWKEPKEIKTFECLILAKFLTDYSLDRTYRGKLPQSELNRYQGTIDGRFRWLLENTFQGRFTYDRVQDTVASRLASYRQVMAENSHPVCWQILASVVTGVDYLAEKDLPTLASSSVALPALLMLAQDALKLAVGR